MRTLLTPLHALVFPRLCHSLQHMNHRKLQPSHFTLQHGSRPASQSKPGNMESVCRASESWKSKQNTNARRQVEGGEVKGTGEQKEWKGGGREIRTPAPRGTLPLRLALEMFWRESSVQGTSTPLPPEGGSRPRSIAEPAPFRRCSIPEGPPWRLDIY